VFGEQGRKVSFGVVDRDGRRGLEGDLRVLKGRIQRKEEGSRRETIGNRTHSVRYFVVCMKSSHYTTGSSTSTLSTAL